MLFHPFILEHVLIAFLMESRNRYKKRISLCHWNIEGFKSSKYSKFQDKEFIDEITKHDVIALTETHAGKGDNLGVEGYTTFLSCRGKHKKARKHSGGVAILVRNYLIRGVEIFRSSSDLMWVRLDKQFFEFKEDLYVGVVYISPQNSVGTRELSEKAWEDLDRDIGIYSMKGKILICGDFNARTGTNIPDFISSDDNQYTPTGDNYIADISARCKKSMDETVNDYGKRLLDMCKYSRLRLLNGRCFGDITGKITCVQWNGCSVVDYFIANEDLLGFIEYFRVHDLKGYLSNHCKISVQLHSCIEILDADCVMQNLSKPPKWSAQMSDSFASLINSNEIMEQIANITNSVEYNSTTDSIRSISEVISSVVPTKRPTTNSKKSAARIRKKWYDSDCRELKRSLNRANRSLQKKPWDPETRESFFAVRKRYKRLIKFKVRKYRDNIISKLNNVTPGNVSEYWNIVDELKSFNVGNCSSSKAALVSSDKWYWHFSKLLNKSETSDESAFSANLRTCVSESEAKYYQ